MNQTKETECIDIELLVPLKYLHNESTICMKRHCDTTIQAESGNMNFNFRNVAQHLRLSRSRGIY